MDSEHWNIRPQISFAITWRIIAELFRRHYASQRLRATEIHPGMGQSDGISILSLERAIDGVYSAYHSGRTKRICDFNAMGQWFAEEEGELFNHVKAYLTAQDPVDVVDRIERRLRIEYDGGKPVPKTTRPVLAFRLIAECLSVFGLSRSSIDVRMCFQDSSEHTGSYVLSDVERFPMVEREIYAGGSTEITTDIADRASNYWMVYQCRPREYVNPRGVIGLDGKAFSAVAPDEEIDLMSLYEMHGRSITDTAVDLITRFGTKW